MKALLAAALLLTLSACGQAADNGAEVAKTAPTTTAPSPTPAASPTAEADLSPWLGRWNGPEGLFLDIKPGKHPGTVALTLKDNLDSQAEYAGVLEGDAIRFERRGVRESIRFGSGSETGFKYLLEMTDCVVVVAGKEGYCRPAG
ncbi:hypothetical protein [Caulobacter sp. NIBR2454]|uniref:hypothetical protein n=1 Tax=Caulobacter sp. NIBR2454 TaxID=3015996 RepID=UPI0022B623C0|nr:hypothetical protein [Caulobacter sp. NIBR2454]